jgi:hypothetical protein
LAECGPLYHCSVQFGVNDDIRNWTRSTTHGLAILTEALVQSAVICGRR